MKPKLPVLFLVCLCVMFSGQTFAQNQTITAVTENYPPFFADNLEGKGWAWMIAKSALESQGYKAELTITPWARAVRTSKRGDYDALFGAFKTEEREEWYYFSLPVGVVRTGLFKHTQSDIQFDGNIKSLESYSIGNGRNYAVSKEFDDADYLNIHTFTEASQGLKMLHAKRIDLLVGPDLVNLALLKDLEPQTPNISKELVFMDPPLNVQFLHFAVSKKTQEAKKKLAAFNKGLKSIIKDGTFDSIIDQYEVPDATRDTIKEEIKKRSE